MKSEPLFLFLNNDLAKEGPVVFTNSITIPDVAKTRFIRLAKDPMLPS